jgi:hypothetical protein
MGLSEPQQRRLEVTLSLIEQTLLELEMCYMTGAITRGEMVKVDNNLTHEQVQQLLDLFETMRQRIGQMRQQFQLQPQGHDLRRLLGSHFSHFWATLHDCRTNKLKGTGAIDPQLKQTLDPQIDELIRLVLEMERVIQGGQEK